MATALHIVLKSHIRFDKDASDLWAAVPAVMSRCDEPATYCMPGAAPAYAWLHLLDRYVRTWLALQQLIEQCLLPMGRQGLRALDVGTGPGPSAFATHDFYAAMAKYSEVSGNEGWRQPAQLTCVERNGAMNHFRHSLAELLAAQGAPSGILDMCAHIKDFKSIHPIRERAELNERMRRAHDDYYDGSLDEWNSEPRYTSQEANYIANAHHRYRLFAFSNFLTTPSTVDCFRANLIDVLTDARPGSVLLIIGGRCHDYPDIYREVGALARDAGFTRKVERLSVSSSASEVDKEVYAEGARFYRWLKLIVGDLPYDNPDARRVGAHFEDQKRIRSPISSVYAYRK